MKVKLLLSFLVAAVFFSGCGFKFDTPSVLRVRKAPTEKGNADIADLEKKPYKPWNLATTEETKMFAYLGYLSSQDLNRTVYENKGLLQESAQQSLVAYKVARESLDKLQQQQKEVDLIKEQQKALNAGYANIVPRVLSNEKKLEKVEQHISTLYTLSTEGLFELTEDFVQNDSVLLEKGEQFLSGKVQKQGESLIAVRLDSLVKGFRTFDKEIWISGEIVKEIPNFKKDKWQLF